MFFLNLFWDSFACFYVLVFCGPAERQRDEAEPVPCWFLGMRIQNENPLVPRSWARFFCIRFQPVDFPPIAYLCARCEQESYGVRNGQDKHRLLAVLSFRNGFVGKGWRPTIRGIRLTERRIDEITAAPRQSQAIVSIGTWIRARIKIKMELRI